MKPGKTKKLSLSAEGRNLIKVRNFVVRYGQKMRLTLKQVSEVKLAVDEAVSNIIRHAYEGKKGGFQAEPLDEPPLQDRQGFHDPGGGESAGHLA